MAILTITRNILANRKWLNDQILCLPAEDLLWIAENRDYAESERYVAREEVHQDLVESDLTTRTRADIQVIFENPTINDPERAYLIQLGASIANLDQVCRAVLKTEANQDFRLPTLVNLWRQFIPLAEIDNAHAMHLSSGMWGWTVFDRLLDEIASVCNDDEFSELLTAGQHDARTRVYTHKSLEFFHRAGSREEFIEMLKDQGVAVFDDGVFALFCFHAVQAQAACSVKAIPKAEVLRQRFGATFHQVLSRLPNSEKERLVGVMSVYQQLHTVRVEYDLYQYYGLYAFSRLLLIKRTCEALGKTDTAFATQFWRAATLYQYSKLHNFILQMEDSHV